MAPYKNPPIVEALCEFKFTLPQGSGSHFLTLPGKLHSALKDHDYTGEPRQQRMQTVMASPTGADVKVSDGLFRIQLPNADATRLLSIGQGSLSVSLLKTYTSWDGEFLPRIEKAIAAYWDVAKPRNVTRVGLRYINKIIIPVVNADPDKYFTIRNPEAGLLKAKVVSASKRLEFACNGGAKFILAYGRLGPEAPDTTVFLLDTDTIWDASPLTSPEAALEKCQALHRQAVDAFELLITDEARKVFNE